MTVLSSKPEGEHTKKEKRERTRDLGVPHDGVLEDTHNACDNNTRGKDGVTTSSGPLLLGPIQDLEVPELFLGCRISGCEIRHPSFAEQQSQADEPERKEHCQHRRSMISQCETECQRQMTNQSRRKTAGGRA